MKVKNDMKVSVSAFDEAAATREVQEELLRYYHDIILKDLEEKVAQRRAQWEEEHPSAELFPAVPTSEKGRETIKPLKRIVSRGRDARGTIKTYQNRKDRRVPCITLEVRPYMGYGREAGYYTSAVGHINIGDYGFSEEDLTRLAQFAHDYLNLIKGGISWIMSNNRKLEKLYGESTGINK